MTKDSKECAELEKGAEKRVRRKVDPGFETYPIRRFDSEGCFCLWQTLRFDSSLPESYFSTADLETGG